MAGKRRDHLVKVGFVGTVLTCVACFTPAAVALLALLGLAGWAGYLDSVLFPLLGFFLVLLGYGYWRRGRAKEAEPIRGECDSPAEGLAEKGGTVSRPTVTVYSTPT